MSVEYGRNPVNWISMIIMGILTTLTFIVTVLLFISVLKFGKSIKNTKRKSQLIFMSISSNTSYTIASLLYFSTTLIAILRNDQYGTFFDLGKMAIGMYMISQLLMVIVFTIRVEVTFAGSGFEYKQSVIKALYIANICLIVLYVSAIFLLINSVWVPAYFAGFMYIVFYLTLSFILMHLFIRKIEILMMDESNKSILNSKDTSKTISTKCPETAEKETDGTVNDKHAIQAMINQEFLYIVIKHGILVPISICATTILFILGLLIGMVIDPSVWHPYSIVWVVLDCFISCVCNYLLFAFNKKKYDTICGAVHRLCKRCKIKQIRRRIDKNNVDLTNVQSNSNKVSSPIESLPTSNI